MKKVIIVILMLVAFTGIQAQNNGFMSVFGGVTMPSGNWTKTAYNVNEIGGWIPTDPANLSSGFAGTGSTFGIEGAYFFSKYFGVGGMVSHSTFGFNGLDTLSAGYRSSFDVDQVTTSVGAGYTMWNFLYGIYFRYPFTEKFSVTAKLLGGFTTATTPSIAVDVFDGGNDDGVFTQEPCTANSFGYMAGIGVSYKILDYLSINLQGNYSSSQPDFLIDNVNRNNAIGRLLTEYNQPLTYMNVTLGVSYLFGSK
jgi:opacity protein-like surface antigen